MTKTRNNNQGTINTILLFIQTGRPLTSVISGILTFTMIARFEQSYCLAIIESIPIIIITMVGFVFNDIYDLEKDKIAKKSRPITQGNLAIKHAFILSFIAIGVSISISSIFASITSLFVIIATLLGVLIYSPFSKTCPLLKDIYTALLCCTPLLYAYAIIGIAPEWIKFLPIILFIFGREIWLDKTDLEGDLASGIKTIAFFLGKGLSLTYSFLCMFIAILIIAFLTPNPLAPFLVGASLFIICYCLFIVKKDEVFAIQISRIAMLLSIFALIL